MTTVSSKKEFQAWLDALPKDQQEPTGRALAFRCALRALPNLADIFGSNMENPVSIIGPTFRATAVAQALRLDPGFDRGIAISAGSAALSAALYAALSAAWSAIESAAGAAAESAALSAALSAARSDGSSDGFAAWSAVLFADGFAGRSADSAELTEPAAGLDVWSALSDDITRLETGTGALQLHRLPLWPRQVFGPDGPGWSQDKWQKLKKILEGREGENWQVWTRWYEDRAAGKEVNAALEVARVSLPNEDRAAGPAVFNAKLMALEARYASLPAPEDAGMQEAGGDTYGLAADGRIKLEPDELADARTDTELANDTHAALKEGAKALEALYAGGNRLPAGLESAVGAYRKALGDQLSGTREIVVVYGNTLEIFLQTDRRLRDPDELGTPMDPQYSVPLQSLVETHGLLIEDQDRLKAVQDRLKKRNPTANTTLQDIKTATEKSPVDLVKPEVKTTRVKRWLGVQNATTEIKVMVIGVVIAALSGVFLSVLFGV